MKSSPAIVGIRAVLTTAVTPALSHPAKDVRYEGHATPPSSKRRGLTYKTPRLSASATPIFSRVSIFNFHTIFHGNAASMKSMAAE